MSSHLPNAPLIYTLGVVRFTRVPEFEKYAEKFFSKIRDQYPYDDKFDQTIMSAQVEPSGVKVRHDLKVMWQYLSVNKDCGFLLGDDMICFHTCNYQDSKKFLGRFKFGLKRLISIEGIGIDYITALGIRYIDLVVPEKDKKLSDYVESWVLPKETPDMGLEIMEGAYLAKYKTKLGYLNFQAVRNPDSLVPPDLQSPSLQKNGWLNNLRSNDTNDCVVIDTDHHMQFDADNNKFEVDKIIANLDELHLIPKKIFQEFGTKEAMKYWNSNND